MEANFPSLLYVAFHLFLWLTNHTPPPPIPRHLSYLQPPIVSPIIVSRPFLCTIHSASIFYSRVFFIGAAPIEARINKVWLVWARLRSKIFGLIPIFYLLSQNLIGFLCFYSRAVIWAKCFLRSPIVFSIATQSNICLMSSASTVAGNQQRSANTHITSFVNESLFCYNCIRIHTRYSPPTCSWSGSAPPLSEPAYLPGPFSLHVYLFFFVPLWSHNPFSRSKIRLNQHHAVPLDSWSRHVFLPLIEVHPSSQTQPKR